MHLKLNFKILTKCIKIWKLIHKDYKYQPALTQVQFTVFETMIYKFSI